MSNDIIFYLTIALITGQGKQRLQATIRLKFNGFFFLFHVKLNITCALFWGLCAEGFGSEGLGLSLQRCFRLALSIQEYRLVQSRLIGEPEEEG